jgi:NAD-dependent deacetylase
MAARTGDTAHGSIVILTGAGISAESGLGTFRDEDGLWTQYPLADLATPEGFARNPALVQDFYNERRRGLLRAKPNAAHIALARLQREWQGQFTLITQNIDDLHERAGSTGVLHMHGELLKARCMACGAIWPHPGDIDDALACPGCSGRGTGRPHVVWFGEIPFYLDRCAAALRHCTLFAAIGTSGSVYPAAAFVELARDAGAHRVELNLHPSENAYAFTETRLGKATEQIPLWVESLLAEA